MIYLVVGPGRTGSLLLCHLISSADSSWPGGLANAHMAPTDSREHVYKVIRKAGINNLVIHTHDPNLVTTLDLPADKITLVMSKRRNIFNTIMSHQITYQTREWHDYTNQTPKTPVHMPSWEFEGAYYEIKNWYNKINLNYPFYRVTEIDYEEILIDDYAIVKERLELTNPGPPGIIKNPSPYNYTDWVSNWQELQELYQKLEKGS